MPDGLMAELKFGPTTAVDVSPQPYGATLVSPTEVDVSPQS